MKKHYEAPAVVVLGSVSDLTQLNMTGSIPDVQMSTTLSGP